MDQTIGMLGGCEHHARWHIRYTRYTRHQLAGLSVVPQYVDSIIEPLLHSTLLQENTEEQLISK